MININMSVVISLGIGIGVILCKNHKMEVEEQEPEESREGCQKAEAGILILGCPLLHLVRAPSHRIAIENRSLNQFINHKNLNLTTKIF